MPTLKGFTFKNQTETSADLYFYGDIVSDWWGAWQDEDQYPDAIKNFLSEQEGKDLNVYVNSGGGSGRYSAVHSGDSHRETNDPDD